MILIQSISQDYSTSVVIQWLCDTNEDFIRLNNKSFIDQITFSENIFRIKINDKIIDLSQFKSYWFRRGSFDFESKLNQNVEMKIPIEGYLKGENLIIKEAIDHYLLKNVKSIGNYKTSQNNKIIACEVAKNMGFKIPDFIITTEKIELLKFYKKHPQIISKSLYGLPGFLANNVDYSAKTRIIELSDIKDCTDNFGVSLFQQYVEKKIELRVFFLNDKFYPSAIFSQNDVQTKIDFRNYNKDKPNRVVPYKLPDDVIEKLKKINQELALNTGSYDLILTPKNEYYFLEVNPIGQFAQVSLPCNYYLEKEIAKELSNA
ncbi:grasp-with-spasm system ATP-grasp peptide maturase [Flavobacterium pectinovorum]|uniref:Grasp-with-spasm system ATP-grasp peptide maturase n=1 Tax=Flavobacterium pectinovorum TaxID=29533 RepID=A0A502F5B0_9FLAO|nr:grasp-with-spasm system ATP-grasp peptide maturase [Flavobacterium pectinovorum]TPG44139.1 grasp-with-spasm system ATP-grasp peptide maturase [Flavobacterium pectinovorum]